MAATPNHALQRTTALAFSCRARLQFDRLSHGMCSTTKPGTCRAFALRRFGHERAFRAAFAELGVVRRLLTAPMNYTLWIDNQAVGPFDACQIADMFLNGVIAPDTQIRLHNAAQTESWKRLGDAFPSITTLPTRSDTMQILSAEIRSTKVPISPHPQHVSVTDIDMPFWSMVGFMIKWAIAAIPAAIILFILFSISSGLLAGLFSGTSHR